MGCVAFTKNILKMVKLVIKTLIKRLLPPVRSFLRLPTIYKAEGWDTVVGSSGTIKACRQIMVNMGWSDEQESVTREGLEKLKDKLLKYKHVSEMEFSGLKEDRRAVLPAGIAILYAAFEVLDIDHLMYSDGALREGVMYDLLGRFKHEDIRDRSVQALMGRYNADPKQAERVVKPLNSYLIRLQVN
jgi:exopolyphosphatase/guanosine-5'-triphosphate,3'-diphosphate pyrophosphatase